MSPHPPDADELLASIREIHDAIRDEVMAACAAADLAEMAAVVGHDAGDTVFAIDRVSERVLVDRFARLARRWPCLLIAEGLGSDGRLVLPAGTAPQDVRLVVIVDPIDGTRGLMYQKRPGWILTGVAAAPHGMASGPPPTLADISLAIQTEIPLVKQNLCDQLWARAGGGATAERLDRISGRREPLALRPSQATTILQGFGGVVRFFPGARAELGAIDDAVAEALLGPPRAGVALCFEDQYLSTGGQLYELMMGHDRWIADLRPVIDAWLSRQGRTLGLCCHPYDFCTALIAREAGVAVHDPWGGSVDAPLDVLSEIAWTGYANRTLRDLIAPVLARVLRERGL